MLAAAAPEQTAKRLWAVARETDSWSLLLVGVGTQWVVGISRQSLTTPLANRQTLQICLESCGCSYLKFNFLRE